MLLILFKNIYEEGPYSYIRPFLNKKTLSSHMREDRVFMLIFQTLALTVISLRFAFLRIRSRG